MGAPWRLLLGEGFLNIFTPLVAPMAAFPLHGLLPVAHSRFEVVAASGPNGSTLASGCAIPHLGSKKVIFLFYFEV